MIRSRDAYNATVERNVAARRPVRRYYCQCGEYGEGEQVARAYPERVRPCPGLMFDLFICDACARGYVRDRCAAPDLRMAIDDAIARYGYPELVRS